VPNRDETAKPAWWILYKDAILETDHGQLPDRIRVAEEAIRARASVDGQVSSAERIEIQHAMAGLLILRRELGTAGLITSVTEMVKSRDERSTD
jgi:hypothetical protein